MNAETGDRSNWPVQCLNFAAWRTGGIADPEIIARMERLYYRQPYFDAAYRLELRDVLSKKGSPDQLYLFRVAGVHDVEIGYVTVRGWITLRYAIGTGIGAGGIQSCL